MASGSKDDPWVLKTPPGSSDYTMYRDEQAEPALLICQVGSTKLTYDLRAIDDLHAWLSAQGEWVPLGAADEKKPAAPSARCTPSSKLSPVSRSRRMTSSVTRVLKNCRASSRKA